MARPMKCFNCLQYGHTKKRCNKPQRCQNCTQEGHKRENCNNESVCLYCKENHKTGKKVCSTQIKEQEILNIQNKYKVGKACARQLSEGISDIYYRNKREQSKFPTHFTVRLENSNRRNINPYVEQNFIAVQIGENPINVRGKGEYYCIKVATEQRSEKMKGIKQIERITCEMARHEQFNKQKH